MALPATWIPSQRHTPATERENRAASAAQTIEWIRHPGEIEPLAEEWRELEASVQDRTVLSTFDYNATWYRHYAGAVGGDALIGVARRGSTLVGVAPLVIRRRRIGRLPLTCVEFAAHEAYAGEFLVEDDRPDTVASFLDSLARTIKFDVVCLNGIDHPGRFDEVRRTAARHRLPVEVTDHPNAIVDLSKGYDGYFRQRKQHFRSGVRRHARRIEAVGRPVIDGIQLTRGLDRIEDAIGRMIAINEASYKLDGGRLADCHRGFLAELVRRFGPRGMLSLPILSIGGRDAAFVIGLVERDCFYDVTLCYDEAVAHLSPGSHLTQELLRDFAGLGVHTFVSHGAHEYKKHWASALVPSRRVFLFSPGIRGTATRFVRFSLRPIWRRLGVPEP
jgi:CelD/BcsL family acetyltransferase involved in cellulose biosynthesis